MQDTVEFKLRSSKNKYILSAGKDLGKEYGKGLELKQVTGQYQLKDYTNEDLRYSSNTCSESPHLGPVPADSCWLSAPERGAQQSQLPSALSPHRSASGGAEPAWASP